MAISDLQPKQGSVNIELDITSKGDVREFQKFGKPGRVCNVEARDATGAIKISLWNEQIDMVNAGDKVRIENGYVNEWQGEMQLTTGRFGKIEIIGKADAPAKAGAVDAGVKEESIE